MSAQEILLGIDISTTGAKALLIDAKGKVISSATTPFTLSTPHPLWSEQDPHAWWRGAVESIHQALSQAKVSGESIVAVGLTGQMHGLVCLDERDRILRPAILWNDQRTAAECEEITSRVGFERLLKISGNKALTGFTAPKILWVRKHRARNLCANFPCPAAKGLRPLASHRDPRGRQSRRRRDASFRPRKTGFFPICFSICWTSLAVGCHKPSKAHRSPERSLRRRH